MKLTAFLNQNDTALAESASDATTKIASTPTLFAISTTNANTLALRATEFGTRVDDVYQARLALEVAINARNTSRTALTTLFQTLLAQSYANPAVTDAAFLSINLDAREPRQARPLRTPLDLKVVPSPNGYITASWKRNQNTSITVFHLQVLSDGVWEEIWAGTRVRVELGGFTPGEEKTFRVVASKSGETSQASNSWTIYGEGSTAEVRLAA